MSMVTFEACLVCYAAGLVLSGNRFLCMGPGPAWISLKLLVTKAATSLPRLPWRRVALALT